MPSIIFCPSRKVVCVGLITFLATSITLSIATLIKILKLTFNKKDLYYCIIIASLQLGISIMVPKFRLYSWRLPL
jgi:hypothetical protein